MGKTWSALPCLLLLLLGGDASADDGEAKPAPLTVEQAADAVLEAVEAKDGSAIKALAEKDVPDPWLVADELCHRAEHDAADAFAKAAPREDTKALPAFVAAQRDSPSATRARAAVDAAGRALLGENPRAALVQLADQPDDAPDVVAVRIHFGRGIAYRSTGELGASSDAYLEAGKRAAALGWLARAVTALYRAGESAYYAGRWDRAIDAWTQRLELEERRSNEEGVARTLSNIGVVYDSKKEYHTALEYQERALKRMEALGDPAPIALALGNIGILHEVLGDLRKALTYQERALAIKEKIGDPKSLGITLSNIGNVKQKVGRHAEAIGHLERALAVFEQLEDVRSVAEVCGNLGVAHAGLGNYARAVEAQERARALNEQLGNRIGVANALVNLGVLNHKQGRIRVALEHQQRALREFETLGDRSNMAAALANIGMAHGSLGDHLLEVEFLERALVLAQDLGEQVVVARQLGNLGKAYFDMGALGRAAAYYERSLALAQELGITVSEAHATGNLGLVAGERGDYPVAIKLAERALAMLEKTGDRAAIARTLGNLGGLYTRLRSYDEALRYQQRALAIKEELGNAVQVALTLGNIGTIHNEMGNYEKALACFERSRALSAQTGDRDGVATSVGNLATVYEAQGDNERALGAKFEALELHENLRDERSVALTLGNVGVSYEKLGDLDKAEEYTQRARTLANRIGVLDTEVRALYVMTVLQLRRGEAAEAAKTAHEAVGKLPLLVQGLADAHGASVRGKWEGLFENGIVAGMTLDDPEIVSFFVESGRAGALLESLGGRQALREVVVSKDLQEAELVARAAASSAQSRLDAAVTEGRRKRIRAARSDLDSAWDALADVVARIQREEKAAADIAYSRAASLAEIQAALGKGEALVSFTVLPINVAALVVTKDDARALFLGDSNKVREAIAELSLDDPRTDPTESLAALRRMLIDPLDLKARRVLISPDAELGYVPFALLMPESEVAYVPSGTTYRVLREERDVIGSRVLGIGDPNYSAPADASPASQRGLYRRRLTPLPGTRQEVEGIADHAIYAADATEAGVRMALSTESRWRSVHFACHGLVDAERPMLSALALTADAEDDGFLTALEIFRMNVPADLVVLSACETAKGRIYQTEGIVGLTRAFMFAGSPRVLCSLWKVDDDATQALMLKFYEYFNPPEGEGLSAAAALKQAQAFVKSQAGWEHPYYWAAWVLWGLPA